MAILYHKGYPILGRVSNYFYLFSKSFLWVDDAMLERCSPLMVVVERWWWDVQPGPPLRKNDKKVFNGLDFWSRMCYNPIRMEAWGQTLVLVILSALWYNKKPLITNGFWLVRASLVGPIGTTMLHTHEVTGSSPVVSTKNQAHLSVCLIFLQQESNPSKCNCPVDSCQSPARRGLLQNVFVSCCLFCILLLTFWKIWL